MQRHTSKHEGMATEIKDGTLKANVWICGGLFTHERLSFGDYIRSDNDFKVHTVTAKDLLKPKLKPDGDYLVLLGLKKMERLLRKERLDRKQISRHIWRFVNKTIPKKIPLIVLDDWALSTLNLIGNRLRRHLFSNFNVKKYMLREYLTTGKYPKEVVSFTIPCNDHTKYSVSMAKKGYDIFFQGNLSNKDRSHLFRKLQKHTKKFRCRYKTMTGGVKNTKDRLSFTEFLKVMGRSKLSLHFSGSGYDCYRYQEIPSVGSIIVSPRYPWVVRNNYEDMKSAIFYSDTKEFKGKVELILKSESAAIDMQCESLRRFKKHHTSKVRYTEFKEFIADAL